MTKTYEIPNGKMIMADVDEVHHMATVSVFALDDLIEAVNKTGHWIFIEENKYGIKVKCSECGAEVYYAGDKCPRCESKMVEPQERNDKK